MREGFLGTAAPWTADLVLLLEIAMGLGLLFGAWLARKKHFGEHGCCQSIIVLLNLAVVAVMMVPSFHDHVMPKIRITRFKVWMRAVLALWWAVVLLGIGTYARWYVPHIFRS